MFSPLKILSLEISFYVIMMLCGLFTAGVNACVTVERQKKDHTDLIIIILFIFVGVLIGSHLLYALVNYKNIIYIFSNIEKITSLEILKNAFMVTFGGSVFYGGLFGGIIAGFIVIKINKNYSIFVDIIAVNAPLFHFFGRIGCFLGGCCFGIPCEHGFKYTINPIAEANGVTRFPVQLLEALFNLCLFFFLNHLLKKEKYKNKLIYVYLSLYAAGRFLIEYLRGDTYRGFWFVFSTSQIISIIIILFILIKFLAQKFKVQKVIS